MRIHLIAFGKLKTAGLREAADYYSKLIGNWRPGIQFEEIELRPATVPDKSEPTRRKIQERESEQLLGRILDRPGQRAFYLLDEKGKALRSNEWAHLLKTWENDGLPAVSLCIGSSLGFSDSLKQQARGLLSLGPQTLPHELARVVLMEQLYRACSILRGHPYHNEG